MNRIHIVGRKNHGKTTLMVDLVRELTARGLRVGTVKHTSHVHDLDTPGRDSYRHRHAGADPSAILTPDLVSVFIDRPPGTNGYEYLARMFQPCDLVLVEGDLDSPGVKIEVWRRSASGTCFAHTRDDIVAVVTDDHLEIDVPVWPRSDIAFVAGKIRTMAVPGSGEA